MEELIKIIMPILIISVIMTIVAKVTGFFLRIMLIGAIVLIVYLFINNNTNLATLLLINVPL